MEHRVKVGDIIDVTITGIQPYGAFASLPDHSSGLIHISVCQKCRKLCPCWGKHSCKSY